MNSQADNEYYKHGSTEPAKASKVTIKRLEKRRKLTSNSQRLVVVLVGLPGRGKSFVARKLQGFFNWRGIKCKVFNVGKYRREAHASLSRSNSAVSESSGERSETGACNANFFDARNEEAVKLRQAVAEAALRDMLKWLDKVDEDDCKIVESGVSSVSSASGYSYKENLHERVAIYDATNSTKSRRKWILEECTSLEHRADKPTGVVFVETICDDEELLEENFRFKISNSPDFKGMSEEEAIDDLRSRVKKYEEQYETIEDDSLSYIKIFNLSSKLLANNIYGRMAKAVVPALMSWNIGTRPIWICRSGQTGKYAEQNGECPIDLNGIESSTKRKQGEHLGEVGNRFRQALSEFVLDEGCKFMEERSTHYSHSLDTGTSISGLASSTDIDIDHNLPFPCKIMTSTMPRAVQTVMWDLPFHVDVISNLNPLDKGDFSGLELEQIKDMDPDWYAQLEKDPYHTRFPGGECYRDLVNRLESCIIDMEQQVGPVLVVSHVSVIQVLLAYFTNSPVEKSASIEVPMHTVIKLTPGRGGGWMKSEHKLLSTGSTTSRYDLYEESGELKKLTTPIWGDHVVPK